MLYYGKLQQTTFVSLDFNGSRRMEGYSTKQSKIPNLFWVKGYCSFQYAQGHYASKSSK
jgi:hypothetical protein